MFFFSLWVAEILRLLSLIKHFYKSFNNVKHLKVRAKKRKKALKHDLHCPKWIFLLYLLFICSDSEPVWRHNLTRPLFVLCLYGCTGCLGCHRNVSEKHVTTCVCVFVRRSSQLWMTAAGYQSCVKVQAHLCPRLLPKVKSADCLWPLSKPLCHNCCYFKLWKYFYPRVSTFVPFLPNVAIFMITE